MQYLNFKKLASNLRDRVFCSNLKYDHFCLTSRNNPVAWLIPIEAEPEVKILGFISIQTLREQISFHVDWLIEATPDNNFPVAFGVSGIDSAHLCYLVVDPKLVSSA